MTNPNNTSSVTIIEKDRCERGYFLDLIRYRELFYFFVWRDILVRYKQALLGVSWSVIRPLLTMFIFTMIFSRIAHLSSGEVSYPLFVLAGMLPWQLFCNAIVDTSQCLIANTNLITKIYFPRIIIPMSQVMVHLVDFAIGMAMLMIFILFTAEIHFLSLLTLPLFVLLTLFLCLGVGLWLSALMVKYRDFRFVLPLIVQFGMFVSPVGYGTFVIPEKWMWLYFCNPMVGIIDGFRWAFFGMTHPYILYSIGASCFVTGALLVGGFVYFRRMENTFADQI